MSERPPLLLSNYFIEKLDYEAMPGFNPAEPGAEVMAVDPDVYPVPDKPDTFMVRLRVALTGPPKSNSRCRLSLSLVGFFQVDAKAPEKLRSDTIFGNAPLILFGIARQVAAETTANGPYGKIILGTVNFVEIFKRKVAGQPESPVVEFKASDKPATRPPRRLNRV
jgi:preprotein translocase subunit SecB